MPTHTDALANVYARSLYELAEQAGGRDKILEVGRELEQVVELARGRKRFGEFLASPVIDRGRRAAALRRIFESRVTDLLLRFLLVLNGNDRLGHLESIGEAYDQLVHQAFGRIEVDVYAATKLDPEHLEAIKKRIGAALGKEPVLYPYEDPAMIGGLKLRIGDRLIDGSIASRLRRLRQTMRTAAPLRGRLARFIAEGGDS